MLRIFSFRYVSGSHYVPPDPGSINGDDYQDKYSSLTITASDQEIAKAAFDRMHPHVKYDLKDLGPA